jgi:hypothetical protein
MRLFPSKTVEELMHEIENRASTRQQMEIVGRLLFNAFDHLSERLHQLEARIVKLEETQSAAKKEE